MQKIYVSNRPPSGVSTCGRQTRFPVIWTGFLTLTLTALLSHQAAQAQITETPPYQSIRVPEAGQQVGMNFTVHNGNAYPVILDYAMLSIFNIGPDPTDYANYPTVTLWNPIIPANGSQAFDYTFTVSTPPPKDLPEDFGVNAVTFSTEWSPLLGSVLGGFFNNGGVTLILDNDASLVPSPTYAQGVTDLLAGQVPTSPIDVGGQQSTVFGAIIVYDTPEQSSTWALLAAGVLALLVVGRWRNPVLAN